MAEQPPAKKRSRGSDNTTLMPLHETPVEERAAALLENSEAEWDAATECVAKALTGLWLAGSAF